MSFQIVERKNIWFEIHVIFKFCNSLFYINIHIKAFIIKQTNQLNSESIRHVGKY